MPYTSEPDGALGFGLSLGKAFNDIGATVMMTMNDLTTLGNRQRMSRGFDLSHDL